MKIHILYEIREKPWGGGNQFLRTLRRWLRKQGKYAEHALDADVLLVNSKDNLVEAMAYTKHGKKIIHRIDGVFAIYRGRHERILDLSVYKFAKNYANAVVFQSRWAQKASHDNGMVTHDHEHVIHNCADDEFFYRPNNFIQVNNINTILSASWSANEKKGFRYYQRLDNELRFDLYEYRFVGRSCVPFKNIKHLGVMSSKELGDALRTTDIFVSGVEDDACSNSIIEAMTCGCAILALNSGGTPEIINDAGILFADSDDLPSKIEQLVNSLGECRKRMRVPTIDGVGNAYLKIAEGL
jgi:glycosyltransferase involved in cell wall biosynthesis